MHGTPRNATGSPGSLALAFGYAETLPVSSASRARTRAECTRSRAWRCAKLKVGTVYRYSSPAEATRTLVAMIANTNATGTFGDRRPDELTRLELEAWRKKLSPGVRPYVFRAFKQVLAWAVARNVATRNPAEGIKNPKRKRHERRQVIPFESWEDVEAVAGELDARYRAIPIFAVGTGLQPEEWIALHRSDVDREAGVVHDRRRYSGWMLKEGGKTHGSVRDVPLRRRVYDTRHTFATWAIEGGMNPMLLAPIMGTSVRELEDTYFRWLSRTDEHVRTMLDNYDLREARHG
jgi:integrase